MLDNDVDPDGDVLTVRLENRVRDGALRLNADGSFTYTPRSNFVGADSFSYRVGDLDVVNVTITVTPVNDAPVAHEDAFAVDEDTPLTGNVLDNDGDIDGGPLRAVLVAQPTHGALTLNLNGALR